ncbi:MAG: hypothetical protein KC621_26620 [Myxococcales bacterium]|nr:hypothetical protein [Myxococcales bacterium]
MIALVWVAPTWAATLGVGPGQAYATISDALTAAAAGDRVEVQPGVYDEQVVITVPLELVGVGGRAATTLRFSGPAPVPVLYVWADATVSGFTVDGEGRQLPVLIEQHVGSTTLDDLVVRDGDSGGAYVAGGIEARGPSLLVTGSLIEGNLGARGGAIDQGAGSLELRDTVVRDNDTTSSRGAAGVYAEVDTLLIERTRFLDNGPTAPALRSWFVPSSVVRDSSFVGNAAGGAQWEMAHGPVDVFGSSFCANGSYGVKVRFQSGQRARVMDSVFGDHTGAALVVDTDSGFPQSGLLDVAQDVFLGNDVHVQVGTYTNPDLVRNNVFAWARGTTPSWTQNETALRADANLWWANAGGDLGGFTSPSMDQPTDVHADPLFVALSDDGDCGNEDLSLQPGSPAIDAGTTAWTDLDGSPSDIGLRTP